MTAKEKALELCNKFYQGSVFDYDKQGHRDEREKAKERALIRVDEILEGSMLIHVADYNYWTDVKQEINKI